MGGLSGRGCKEGQSRRGVKRGRGGSKTMTSPCCQPPCASPTATPFLILFDCFFLLAFFSFPGSQFSKETVTLRLVYCGHFLPPPPLHFRNTPAYLFIYFFFYVFFVYLFYMTSFYSPLFPLLHSPPLPSFHNLLSLVASLSPFPFFKPFY